MITVDNAIIMAAGFSSRFAPLSRETHKALLPVRGEILIERQIRQLQEAGIRDITVVTGYKKEQFHYLREKFQVDLTENPDYQERNNHSSIWAVRDRLKNTYICSADNYFSRNPFHAQEESAYYSCVYAQGKTREWCVSTDTEGWIRDVTIGGENSWYFMGHVFWTREFSEQFLSYLENAYPLPETKDKFWENIYMEHLDRLDLKIRKFPPDVIFEFDSLDELRQFDSSYRDHTHSRILESIARDLGCREGHLENILPLQVNNHTLGFSFEQGGHHYRYLYQGDQLLAE